MLRLTFLKGKKTFLIYLVSVGLLLGTNQDIGGYPEVDSLALQAFKTNLQVKKCLKQPYDITILNTEQCTQSSLGCFLHWHSLKTNRIFPLGSLLIAFFACKVSYFVIQKKAGWLLVN